MSSWNDLLHALHQRKDSLRCKDRIGQLASIGVPDLDQLLSNDLLYGQWRRKELIRARQNQERTSFWVCDNYQCLDVVAVFFSQIVVCDTTATLFDCLRQRYWYLFVNCCS